MPADPRRGVSTTRRHHIRHLANWLNLSTPLGLLMAVAGGARLRRGPWRLLLAERYRWPFPTGGAFTVGDVVISRYELDRLLTRTPRLLEHEEVHSRQWMLCGGLPFLPLYLASVGWSWARTGDRAARSAFERRAGLGAGGYRDVPVRPLLPRLAAATSRARTALAGRHVSTADARRSGAVPQRPLK